jgi:hypothetical protein
MQAKVKGASKVKGNLEAWNRMMWNPQNREIMMEGNLSIETQQRENKEHTRL